MRKTKNQISLYLCMMLAFIGILLVMPTEAKAEDIRYIDYPDEVWVYEKAKEFYAGDLITYSNPEVEAPFDDSYLVERDDVRYKSSKTSVAKIDKKTGKITTQKQGTTTIKVEYKGGYLEFTLKVVSEKKVKKKLKELKDEYIAGWEDDYKLDYEEVMGENAGKIVDISSVNKKARTFLKAAGTDVRKVTAANRYKLLRANFSYKYDLGLESEVVRKKGKGKEYQYIYSTEALHAYVLHCMLENYSNERDIFYYDKSLQVKKISAKTDCDEFTIKLNKKITADQIFGAHSHFSWGTDIRESKEYTYPFYVLDKKTKYKYYAIGTMKKDSNTITVKMKTHKMKKNGQYQIITWYGKDLPHNEYSFCVK